MLGSFSDNGKDDDDDHGRLTWSLNNRYNRLASVANQVMQMSLAFGLCKGLASHMNSRIHAAPVGFHSLSLIESIRPSRERSIN